MELLISAHGLAEVVAEGHGQLRTGTQFFPVFAAARWELVGHCYVYIEGRTEGAGWLVLQSPTSVNLR